MVFGMNFKTGVKCRFDNIVVTGEVSKRKDTALCVTPMFARVGVIPMSVSVDGGRTFSPAVDFHLGRKALYKVLHFTYTCASVLAGALLNMLLYSC